MMAEWATTGTSKIVIVERASDEDMELKTPKKNSKNYSKKNSKKLEKINSWKKLEKQLEKTAKKKQTKAAVRARLSLV